MSPVATHIASGLRDKTIRLQGPGGPPVPDGDGGYTTTPTDLAPSIVKAHIAPATATDLERNAAGTSIATASHLITILYHPQVTTETVITYDDQKAGRTRTFSVTGVQNPEEANIVLVLTAEE